MALEAFYETIGGDIAGVRGVLLTDERIKRFVNMFFEDGSYTELCESLAANDMATAFRAAHTLKGLAQNVYFTRLYEVSDSLTEALRPASEDQAVDLEQVGTLMDAVTTEYAEVKRAAELAF